MRKMRAVPANVSAMLQEEMAAEDEDIVVVDGRLTKRIGAALRIARSVKLRFGGTPEYNKANWVLSSRYIVDACVAQGITRDADQWLMVTRARPIIFVPLQEEKIEAQTINCDEAFSALESVEGWGTRRIHWFSRWWCRRELKTA